MLQTNYSIREVRNETEKKDALRVRRLVFINEQQVPEEIEVDEHDAENSETVHFVAYKANEPVAAGRLRNYAQGIGKVERVAVLSSERGTGLGKQMMQAIEQSAVRLGYSTLKLNAQYHAKAFYENLGYTAAGELFVEAGIDHIAMEKKLC